MSSMQVKNIPFLKEGFTHSLPLPGRESWIKFLFSRMSTVKGKILL